MDALLLAEDPLLDSLVSQNFQVLPDKFVDELDLFKPLFRESDLEAYDGKVFHVVLLLGADLMSEALVDEQAGEGILSLVPEEKAEVLG